MKIKQKNENQENFILMGAKFSERRRAELSE